MSSFIKWLESHQETTKVVGGSKKELKDGKTDIQVTKLCGHLDNSHSTRNMEHNIYKHKDLVLGKNVG